MLLYIILGLFVILLVSFYLAYRSLSELTIPEEILKKISEGKTIPKYWGVIIFLKGKIVHYSSSSSSSLPADDTSPSSSINSSNSSERIEL